MSWLVCRIYYSVIYDILKHSFVRFGKKWFIVFLISQIVCFLGVRIFSIIFFSWQNAYRFYGPVILLGLSFIAFLLQSKRINFPCLSSIRFLVYWSLLILNNILVIAVPIALIASFRRMKKLVQDLSLIEAALRTSSHLVSFYTRQLAVRLLCSLVVFPYIQ